MEDRRFGILLWLSVWDKQHWAVAAKPLLSSNVERDWCKPRLNNRLLFGRETGRETL